jgi:uncharacterized protein
MSDPNIETVQMIYAAFGRGDVDSILAALADDVDWASEAGSPVAPWHGRRTGKAEVAQFFAAVAEVTEVTEFAPVSFAANDTDVMAIVDFAFKVPATGKSGSMQLHHWWRLSDGKVTLYRGSEDTALVAATLTP